ncbi:MAG: haloacid dehalogenase-like hydrolase [Bacteroidales bacterium]|nr:haloacid dehalogenase-like hydrolase [Bacteroidales bacterium]
MATKEYIDVALVYDFDGTLSPGNMQEFGFVQAIGKDSEAFWTKTNELAMKNDADGILCYMYLMMEEARANNVSLRRESFVKFGSKIKLFKGVEQWFEMINKYGKTLGLNIKHYVNSSGLKEMIEGTSIAKNFERIYACSFLYNVDDVAYWPAVAVNYTTKTQFLFKINKGIKEVSDNTIINKYLAQEDRPMPFERMIYFGDGDTDIPSMKVVKEHGGHAIAVYGKRQKRSTAMRLIKDGRVNFACTADYSEGKDIHNVVKTILQKIRADYDFQKLLDNHQEEAEKEVSL